MTINLEDIHIRPSLPKDISTVIEKHKSLYYADNNYPPSQFGKYVTEAITPFLQHHPDSTLWIAEYTPTAPEPPTSGPLSAPVETVWAGCVAVVHTDETTGRLRFMLVDPRFRSCGLGRRLLETALEFCRERKYCKVTLSTAEDCVAARKLYALYGFKLVKVTGGTPWGVSTDEWWEKKLE
jgi:GNAT superfamily N-acetyltransferase